MRVQVAVGILVKPDRSLLVQQRRPGTDCAGQWEFPGGKLEAGEMPEQALKRELKEELDIEITSLNWLTQLDHDYDHACVSLHAYLVDRWTGTPRGVEGQSIAWNTAAGILKYDLLEAAHPLLAKTIEQLGL